jgi:SAM-dependent methyltransferase
VRACGVRDGDTGPGLLLCREGSAFTLHAAAAPRNGLEVIGAVTGLERGRAVLTVDVGLGRLLAVRHWPVAVAIVEVLRRFRHPFTPPLFQGSRDALLRGVRDKYDAAVETTQYGAYATGELVEIERALVEEHVAAGGRVLDIGCGGGREAVGFARLGYRVVGIDIAPGMIEVARASAARLGLAIDFRVQSATGLDEPPGSYDGAFFGGSLHHVPGRTFRIETLARVRRALTPAGVLILMVVYRERRGLLSRSRAVDAVRALARALGGGSRFSEPGDSDMCEVSHGSDPARACFFHNYDGPGEIRGELQAAGFTAHEAAPGWWVCRPAPPALC